MTTPTSPPVIEVSHLPSAASFYAAITQPLGLRYLSSSASPSPTRLRFGRNSQDCASSSPQTVFALQQASLSTRPLRSIITLSASSPAAVEAFYKKALLANNAQRNHEFEKIGDEEARARIEDLDGNMLEAVYSARAGRRVATLETASTEKEARRVLAWQHEVARSTVASDAGSDAYGPQSYRRADTYPRMVTTEARDGGGSGFTGMKAVGMVLGAAAGAAVAYAMVRSDSPPPQMAPPMRRSSYGDHVSQYSRRPIEPVRGIEGFPARSYVSVRDSPPSKYADYRIAAPPTRAMTDLARIDQRSHVSHRSERGSRGRSRSEVDSSRYERPVTILQSEARSPVASHVSHHSHTSGSHHSKRDADKDSYISARSHRTEITVKPAQHVSATPSRVTTTTIRMVPKSERKSEVSYARHVPLPSSIVSGRAYEASVAPSDSVSSVGNKRERERLRERMSVR